MNTFELIGSIKGGEKIAKGIIAKATQIVCDDIDAFNESLTSSAAYLTRKQNIQEEDLSLLYLNSSLKELKILQKEYDTTSDQYEILNNTLYIVEGGIERITNRILRKEFGIIDTCKWNLVDSVGQEFVMSNILLQYAYSDTQNLVDIAVNLIKEQNNLFI